MSKLIISFGERLLLEKTISSTLEVYKREQLNSSGPLTDLILVFRAWSSENAEGWKRTLYFKQKMLKIQHFNFPPPIKIKPLLLYFLFLGNHLHL